MRRLLAVLSVLALTLCVGRVGAWASPAASAHACCQAPKGRPAPVMDSCCPVAAATIAPRLSRILVAVAIGAAPDLRSPRLQISFATAPTAPPGALAGLTSAPARAPPLA